jgi:hypothetical protein
MTDRNWALRDALQAIENERLCDPCDDEDEAYNQAIDDALPAIRALIDVTSEMDAVSGKLFDVTQATLCNADDHQTWPIDSAPNDGVIEADQEAARDWSKATDGSLNSLADAFHRYRLAERARCAAIAHSEAGAYTDDGEDFAQVCTPDGAAQIVAAFTQRASIAAMIEREGEKRGRHMARAGRILADAIRHGFDLPDEPVPEGERARYNEEATHGSIA